MKTEWGEKVIFEPENPTSFQLYINIRFSDTDILYVMVLYVKCV